MSGHVFHPGHDELHGVTVIVNGRSGKTYVGRWHERSPRGITMRDVAVHDPVASPASLEAWLDRQRKFGVAATERHFVVGAEEAGEVRPLEE